MAAIPTTDRCPWQASAYLLTDPVLWRCITSFQRGIPLPLYDFRVAHEPHMKMPARGPFRFRSEHYTIKGGMPRLVSYVVKHGTVTLLDMVARVCRENGSEWESEFLCDVSQDAVAANRPEMLEWAIAHNVFYGKPQDVWSEAIEKFTTGDYRVLELVRTHKPIRGKLLVNIVASISDVDFLRWLDLHAPGAVTKYTLEHAARERNLEAVQYIVERHPTMQFDEWPFTYAWQRGHLAMLRYLLEQRPTQAVREFITELIMRGKPEEREILRDVGGFEDVAREVAERHIRNGYVEDLQCLFDEGLLSSGEPFSIDQAALWGRLDVIQLLDKRNMATATTEAMDSAAEMREWGVVKYLHEHRSEGYTTRVLDAATDQGHLEELEFYRANLSDGMTREQS